MWVPKRNSKRTLDIYMNNKHRGLFLNTSPARWEEQHNLNILCAIKQLAGGFNPSKRKTRRSKDHMNQVN